MLPETSVLALAETWVVNLWVSNDAEGESYFGEMAQEIWNEAVNTRTDGSVLFTRDEVATRILSDPEAQQSRGVHGCVSGIGIGDELGL